MVIDTGRKHGRKCKDLIEEQRVYCKVRALLGISPSDIIADLDVVYGGAALKYTTITKWMRRFKEGRTDFKDEPRPGRPLLAVWERDIEVVKTAIEEDARHSVEEIGDLYGINSSAVFYILKEVLKLKKVCARWIPHLLTNEQKGGRVEKASQLLARYKNADFRRLHEIVTGDETWLYFFEPDCKENNKVWVSENGARPQIARRNKTSRRVMYALFFDCEGIVA